MFYNFSDEQWEIINKYAPEFDYSKHLEENEEEVIERMWAIASPELAKSNYERGTALSRLCESIIDIICEAEYE